jgi:HK97 family phage portal protein
MAFWNRTPATPPRARVEPRVIVNASDTPLVGMSELTGSESWLFGTTGQATWGPPVTEHTAMAVSAVFRCVTMLSGLFASLPLKVFTPDPDGSHTEATGNRVAVLLEGVPHPRLPMTAYQWRELWGLNFLLYGNHFSAIRYDGAGRIVGFEPIAAPWLVDVLKLASGRLVYRFNWPDRAVEVLDQADVIHITGPGFDGVRAPSRIAFNARNAVALGQVLGDSAGHMHENGAKLTGMVELPANVTKPDKDKIEAYYRAKAQGRHNAGSVLFVDKDTKFTPMQMNAEDLALIESRRFQIEDICRFFGVPPHLVGESAANTSWGSGIEQQTLGFLRYTLNPDLKRIEAEINAKVFPGSSTFVQFDRDAMLAMDAKTLAEVNSLRIGSSQRTINEVRRRDHLPPVAGGDEPLVNSTIIPLKRALEGKPPNAPPSNP